MSFDLSLACELDQSGQRDKSLDVLYERVDQAFRNGDFDQVNVWLANFDCESQSLDFLLGILTTTNCAKSKLPNRQRIFDETKRIAKKIGQFRNTLLSGLE